MTRRGYFILEALVAMMVLAVAVSSMVGSLQSATLNVQSAKNQAVCLAKAESVIEMIRFCRARRWYTDSPFIGTWWFVEDPSQLPPFNLYLPTLYDSTLISQYRVRTLSTLISSLNPTPIIVTFTHNPPPPVDLGADKIFYVEVCVQPANQASPPEGASMSVFLSSRGGL